MGCASTKEKKPRDSIDVSAERKELKIETQILPLDQDCILQIHEVIQRNNLSMADLKTFLLSFENGIEASGQEGIKPLHIASTLGFLPVVKLLLEMGAQINSQCAKGNTPLHYAIGENRFDCATYLKVNGADCLILNGDGHRADSGVDGKSNIGLAALYCASNSSQADIALKICLSQANEINLFKFLEYTSVLRRRIEWSDYLEGAYQAILEKLHSSETSYNDSLSTAKHVVEDDLSNKMCRPPTLTIFRCF